MIMRTLNFSIIAIVAVLAASCSKQETQMMEDNSLRSVTLNATCSGAGSKVMLDSCLKTVWNMGDSVSVFYEGSSVNARASYIGEDGAVTGSIVFSDTSRTSTGSTIAAIPYRSGNRRSGSILYSRIPFAQYCKEGSYDGSAALLVASSSTDKLDFRYACAVLCFELKSYSSAALGIRSITLSSEAGEYIAGDVRVDMSCPDSPRVSVTENGISSIVLSGGELSPTYTIPAYGSRKFYFCVAPSELSGGYRYDILLSDGTIVTGRNTSSLKFVPGELYSIRCGFSRLYHIVIDFGETSFNPALPASSTTASGTVHTFTNPSDGNSYSIRAYSSGGYYRTKVDDSYCLRFNAAGDCLKLPSMAGKRLARFGAMVRQSAAYKPMSVSSTRSSSGDVVPSLNYTAGEMTWTSVYDAAADTPLYLYMEQINTQISRIEMYFE